MNRAVAVLVGFSVVGALAVGCAPSTETSPGVSAGWSGIDALAAPDVAGLPEVRETDAAPVRLADDLAPPTNRWFSSLAFAADPLPVYPYPLAFAPSVSGFAMQLPEVSVAANTVAASFTGGLGVELGATDFVVARYDPVSVTLRYSAGERPLADVTIAEGSPIVSIVALDATSVALDAPLAAEGEGTWRTSVAGRTYGVRAPSATATSAGFDLAEGAVAQLFAVADGSTVSAWSDALGDPVTGVETTYRVDADTVSTRLTYAGTDRTVVVPFVGREAAADCDLGTFDTAYGPASACRSTALEWSVPRVGAAASYDFDGLDGATTAELSSRIADDLAAATTVPADTYFGGKGLARLASIAALARSIGDAPAAERATDLLVEALAPWLEEEGCLRRAERCFGYDPVLGLVVGQAASFGSEEGNDHHFHYGYFLYAAAVLAAERPDAVDGLRPVIDLLAADIAGGASGSTLPPLRVFDPYVGHSWASGVSPFADGNNQESSSEAVAAWNGLALWAEASDDADLAARASWLLSSEADAARGQWLAPDDLPAGFDHEIFSILWGGKRDYATWFSAEPSAILGIQLLPVGAVGLEYLSGDPEGVAARVAGAGGDAAFDGVLGDYVLLYSALAGPDAREAAEARAAETTEWDDGLSTSAVWAWFAAVERAEG